LSEFSGARTGYGADMQWIYIALSLIAGWWGAKAFMERKAGRAKRTSDPRPYG